MKDDIYYLWNYSKTGTIATYVFMPILKLHVKKYEDTLIDVYCSFKDEIYLLFKQEQTNSELLKHPYYKTDFTLDNDEHLIVYTIPKEHHQNYLFFMSGSYSKFTPELKALIETYSGLKSNNILICAINKREVLKKVLQKELNCVIDDDQELMSAPSNENYRSLEDFFKEELEQQ